MEWPRPRVFDTMNYSTFCFGGYRLFSVALALLACPLALVLEARVFPESSEDSGSPLVTLNPRMLTCNCFPAAPPPTSHDSSHTTATPHPQASQSCCSGFSFPSTLQLCVFKCIPFGYLQGDHTQAPPIEQSFIQLVFNHCVPGSL